MVRRTRRRRKGRRARIGKVDSGLSLASGDDGMSVPIKTSFVQRLSEGVQVSVMVDIIVRSQSHNAHCVLSQNDSSASLSLIIPTQVPVST